MAAAYQTGTATSPTDLLQKFVTWLVVQGWTNNMSQADGTGWRAHLSKGGIYINLRATPGSEVIFAGGVGYGTTGQIGIGFYLGTGYSGASAWNAQVGSPVGSGQIYMVGVFVQMPSGAITAYHFFDDGSDNVVVVIEKTAGIFTHLGWGSSIIKAGNWAGGAYFWGGNSGYNSAITGYPGSATISANPPFSYFDSNNTAAAFVRCDIDAFIGKWLDAAPTTLAYAGYTGKYVASSHVGPGAAAPPEIPSYGLTLQGWMTSTMNSQANLFPARIFAQRDVAGYSLIGDIPNIFYSNGVGNGFAAGSIYPIGLDNYMMFPGFAVLKKA